jgi:hypothetical protein
MNKPLFFVISSIFLVSITLNAQAYEGLSFSGMIKIPNPNNQLLPSSLSVYTNGSLTINHPAPGLKQVSLPVNNKNYTKANGCYMACYSYKQGLIREGKNIYLIGMVRVPGKYNNNRSCIPTGTAGKDVSGSKTFKMLCNNSFKKQCSITSYGCWAGGDTGGWYGMQQSKSVK